MAYITASSATPLCPRHKISKGTRWRSGRASDSESRSPEFDPHRRRRVASLSKIHYFPTVLVKPRKRWLHPNMTEKLLTGTLSLNTNKQTKFQASSHLRTYSPVWSELVGTSKDFLCHNFCLLMTWFYVISFLQVEPVLSPEERCH